MPGRLLARTIWLSASGILAKRSRQVSHKDLTDVTLNRILTGVHLLTTPEEPTPVQQLNTSIAPYFKITAE